ncbi:MAG: tetratricopeptide repeat protein [Alphaproteobacteria bacterium]|nr:tetratricopeptide repeat protein [Alphaproteobacteria bacterium]
MLRRPSILVSKLATVMLLFAAGTTGTANAQVRLSELSATEAYRACILQTQKDAEAGFEAAIAWRDEGGGPPALHCVALALFDMGQLDEAAKRLETMVDQMPDASDHARASVLGQAGRVWLQLRELDRAYTVLSKSLQLDGSDPELWIDRGETLARGQEYWDAIDDFSGALDRAPGHLDALIFRAAAYRLLNVDDLARDDIDRVLNIAPDHPDALMELGRLYARSGALDDARTTWLRVLSLSPGSAAAAAARGSLEQMDVTVE